MKKPPILNRLETLASEIATYQHLQRRSYRGVQLTLEDKELKENMRVSALKNMGILKPLITEITGKEKLTITKTNGQQFSYDLWLAGLSSRFDVRANDALNKCLDLITITIGRLEDDISNGKRDKSTGEIIGVILGNLDTSVRPKAFIAHEGETRALVMLKEFLETLGIQYFIAEAEASDGRSVEGQVDWTQAKADFAICLATKGKAVNKKTGKHYMGLNVADELGRARQVYGNHIILLVQKGVEVHTNPREIVHETFTTTNMEKAFLKIVKELKNWDYLKTGKIKEQSS